MWKLWERPSDPAADGLSGFLSERLSVWLSCLSVCLSCLLLSSDLTISPLHLRAALSQLRTKACQWLASPGASPAVSVVASWQLSEFILSSVCMFSRRPQGDQRSASERMRAACSPLRLYKRRKILFHSISFL